MRFGRTECKAGTTAKLVKIAVTIQLKVPPQAASLPVA
jgi:hypothetical protein